MVGRWRCHLHGKGREVPPPWQRWHLHGKGTMLVTRDGGGTFMAGDGDARLVTWEGGSTSMGRDTRGRGCKRMDVGPPWQNMEMLEWWYRMELAGW